MALIFMDGFDHYATADITKKWNSASSSSTVSVSSAAARRNTGSGVRMTNGGNIIKSGLPSISTIIVGVGMQFLNFVAQGNILELRFSSTVHLALRIETNGALSILRGTTPLATSTFVFSSGSYYYVELKATIDDLTGTYEIRVNNVSILSATGVDTRNSSTAACNEIRLTCPFVSAFQVDYDDFYVCDTSGSSNNNFIGDVRIDTLYPNADGTYSQFLPSSGTVHYTLVDEAAPNTTDYNDGLSVGSRDSYAMTDLAPLVSQTIFGVQVNAAVMKDDAGAKSAATMVRSGSTNGDGASSSLSTSQMYISQVFEKDPNGSTAWTEASVNAMEAGVLVTA